MRAERFVDQYEAAAEAYGVEVEQLKLRDAGQSQELYRWLAFNDQGVAGAVTTWHRPDNRTFLMFGCPDQGSYLPLTQAVWRDLRKPLYVSSDSRDPQRHQQLLAAGYQVEMTSEIFEVQFGPVLDRLKRVTVPGGFQIVSAADVALEELLSLDNALREEVSGTDGWVGDIEWLRSELAESPPFDPNAYLVGLSRHGAMTGLVRIWRNDNGPRFGMVATLPEFRGTLIGPALVRRALTAASAWGYDSFVTETSIANRHVHPRLRKVGAKSLGFYHQMVFATD